MERMTESVRESASENPVRRQTKFIEFRDALAGCRYFEQPKNPCLKRVVESFVENFDRAILSTIIPGAMAFAGVNCMRGWQETSGDSERFDAFKKRPIPKEHMEQIRSLADGLIIGADSPSEESGPIWKG